MAHPEDITPIDVMVEHQRRMLSIDGSAMDVLVLDNRLNGKLVGRARASEAYEAALRRLTKAGVRVRPPDGELLEDATLLDQFFSVPSQSGAPLPISSWVRPLTKLLGPGGSPSNRASWIGVLSFLRECLGGVTELCVWSDSDIFVWRSGGLGLLDVALRSFEAHPQFFLLSPPFPCNDFPLGHTRNECCHSVASHHYFSQRMMVFHRRRLSDALPLVIPAAWRAQPPTQPTSASIAVPSTLDTSPATSRSPSEEVLYFHLGGGRIVKDALLQRGGGSFEEFVPRVWKANKTYEFHPPRGVLGCGHDVFSVHPPSRFQSTHKTLDFTQLLQRLANASSLPLTAEATRRGVNQLIERFEAGKFDRDEWSIFNDAGHGVCTDMVPRESRIMNDSWAWRRARRRS